MITDFPKLRKGASEFFYNAQALVYLKGLMAVTAPYFCPLFKPSATKSFRTFSAVFILPEL